MLRYTVVPFSFASSLEQQCYDTRCAFPLQSSLEQKCYDMRLCLFCGKPLEQHVPTHVVPFLFAAHWSNVLRDTLCFHCSSKRAWSVTATSHVSCAGTLCFSRVQVTLRLCRTFPGFSAILEIRNSKLNPRVSKVTHSNLTRLITLSESSDTAAV